MMAGIRGKETKPELALRRALHARGFRYRLHSNGLPGRPDLIMPKFRAAVFVHGCFWHRHTGCRYMTTPATRPDFWRSKFVANVARDRVIREALIQAGWRVVTVWECSLRKTDHVEAAAEVLAAWLPSDGIQLDIEEKDVLRP